MNHAPENLIDPSLATGLPPLAAERIEAWKTLMARGQLHFMGEPGHHTLWLVVDDPEEEP